MIFLYILCIFIINEHKNNEHKNLMEIMAMEIYNYN